MQWDKGKLWGD